MQSNYFHCIVASRRMCIFGIYFQFGSNLSTLNDSIESFLDFTTKMTLYHLFKDKVA